MNRYGIDGGESGETVLAALVKQGAVLSAPCGGRGLCGKCRVKLIEGRVRELETAGRTSGEENAAEGGIVSGGLIPACKTVPLGGILVELLPETFDGNEVDGGCLDPEFLSAAAGSPRRAGAALDIGTTTLSAQAVDLDTGQVIAVHSCLNGQKLFGADVMSRISAAREGKTGELFRLINDQTEELLHLFMERCGLSSIETLAVSGNTAMLHLFVNEDPSGLGEVPFTPVFLESRDYAGAELGLSAGRVRLLPSISSFVGSDITAGLAALDIFRREDGTFLVDIGTNGEMALLRGGGLLCCSTAAGPCFEGAEISCGMGAVRGAIDRVAMKDGRLSFTTIGGAKPRGICGCGLIDAAALMLKTGVIDETGAFAGGRGGFPLAPGIALTQGDIRQFQLAKSAILSGVRILCRRGGMEPGDLAGLFIAGGFGFFIGQENAITAGVLPDIPRERIAVCGNLSLKGAVQSLTDRSFFPRCEEIAAKSQTIDLAADPAFMDEFAENMIFP
ncbi:MAG: ASKHA domain-containing protein [Treponema sp.]|nr:ASKHA domain-containing protein [Treponema sp.]